MCELYMCHCEYVFFIPFHKASNCFIAKVFRGEKNRNNCCYVSLGPRPLIILLFVFINFFKKFTDSLLNDRHFSHHWVQ